MFLYSLLSVSEETTEIVKWISVGGVLILLLAIALIGYFSSRQKQNAQSSAKEVAFAGICVATSFTLALLKIPTIESGGSITIASFVPIMLYAYAFGPTKGFIVGLIHGLLNFIEDPFILTPATFVFDYLLAFMSVGIMGFFGKIRRKEREALPIILGALCVFAVRFLSHLLSGMIFFSMDSVWVTFPEWATANAFIYSFIYQCIYIPADALIAIGTLIALCKTGAFDRLIKIMKPCK
jgi:thiamine transporter